MLAFTFGFGSAYAQTCPALPVMVIEMPLPSLDLDPDGATLAATENSATVALPGADTQIVVTNVGNFVAYVALGTTATEADGYPVLPKEKVVLDKGSATAIAAITAVGSSTILRLNSGS